MCKCTPEIRTPFCGKPGCEAPEANVNRYHVGGPRIREPVQTLVPWGEATPQAIAQQLLARVIENQKDGIEQYVFNVIIHRNERGNLVTTITNTPCPYEIGLLAADALEQWVKQ